MNETPKTMSSKRNIIILVIVLAIVIVGGIIAAVAVGTSGKTDIAKTLTLAERYLDEEDYEQAIIEFERILEIDPMNVDAYIGKAKALIALGDEDEAEKLLQKAYELTGSEEIMAMIGELSQSADTTTSVSATIIENNVSEEPVHDREYALAIEQMLYEYINNSGELDTGMLEAVTYITIYGNDAISVSCGNARGSEWEYISLNSLDRFTVNFSDGTSQEHPRGTVTDISFLRHMPNLTGFDICYNEITSIPDLSMLPALSSINLSYNNISDISGLNEHKNVYMIHLSFNNITDISALSTLPQLELIMMDNNQITDLSPISSLTEIYSLDVSCNKIYDISPVAGLTNMKYLNVGNACNSVIANEVFETIGYGQESTDWLDAFYNDHNHISDISSLAGMTQMENLDLFANEISDISALSGMARLKCAGLAYNPLNEDDVAALQTALPECSVNWFNS